MIKRLKDEKIKQIKLSWPILTYLDLFYLVLGRAGPPTHLFASCLVSLRGFFFPKKWRLFVFENVFYVFSRKSEFLGQDFSLYGPREPGS